jgi:hypothetical protein
MFSVWALVHESRLDVAFVAIPGLVIRSPLYVIWDGLVQPGEQLVRSSGKQEYIPINSVIQ